MKVVARAPGRVNLIGDHTDYTGGLVLPIAIDLTTTVELEPGVPWVELVSDAEPDPAFIPLDAIDEIEPRLTKPAWARLVAGVMAVLRPEVGGVGFVTSSVPVGAGLSSSAALEVAVALALGFEGTAAELALACQRAEHLASGVPCGVMDQLTAAAGVEGSALLIDCRTLDVLPVALPPNVAVVVVHSGATRSLATAPYGVRRAQCEEAELLVGPLRDATRAAVENIERDDLRRRARHVVTENERVRAAAAALAGGRVDEIGHLMVESHKSLRDDFGVSTPTLDAIVDSLVSQPGVHGARLTGAGFGGCVVALADEQAVSGLDTGGYRTWRVRAAGAASVSRL